MTKGFLKAIFILLFIIPVMIPVSSACEDMPAPGCEDSAANPDTHAAEETGGAADAAEIEQACPEVSPSEDDCNEQQISDIPDKEECEEEVSQECEEPADAQEEEECKEQEDSCPAEEECAATPEEECKEEEDKDECPETPVTPADEDADGQEEDSNEVIPSDGSGDQTDTGIDVDADNKQEDRPHTIVSHGRSKDYGQVTIIPRLNDINLTIVSPDTIVADNRDRLTAKIGIPEAQQKVIGLKIGWKIVEQSGRCTYGEGNYLPVCMADGRYRIIATIRDSKGREKSVEKYITVDAHREAIVPAQGQETDKARRPAAGKDVTEENQEKRIGNPDEEYEETIEREEEADGYHRLIELLRRFEDFRFYEVSWIPRGIVNGKVTFEKEGPTPALRPDTYQEDQTKGFSGEIQPAG